MYKNLKKSQMNDTTESMNSESNEELLAVREEIEFLRELVETQDLHIHHLQNELLEVNQELEVINDELAKTLMLGVSFDEAKAIAKTMLNSEEGSSELVENLLNILYGLSVQPEESKEKVKFDIQTSKANNQLTTQVVIQSQQLKNSSKQMRLQRQELGNNFMTFQANLNQIREHLTDSTNSQV